MGEHIRLNVNTARRLLCLERLEERVIRSGVREVTWEPDGVGPWL